MPEVVSSSARFFTAASFRRRRAINGNRTPAWIGRYAASLSCLRASTGRACPSAEMPIFRYPLASSLFVVNLY